MKNTLSMTMQDLEFEADAIRPLNIRFVAPGVLKSEWLRLNAMARTLLEASGKTTIGEAAKFIKEMETSNNAN